MKHEQKLEIESTTQTDLISWDLMDLETTLNWFMYFEEWLDFDMKFWNIKLIFQVLIKYGEIKLLLFVLKQTDDGIQSIAPHNFLRLTPFSSLGKQFPRARRTTRIHLKLGVINFVFWRRWPGIPMCGIPPKPPQFVPVVARKLWANPKQ